MKLEKNKQKKVGFLALVMLFIFISCAESENKSEEAEQISEISTFELKTSDFSSFITVPAEFKAYEKVDLFPKVDGYIESFLVDRGDFVKKGEVLALINAPEINARLASAKADYQSKQAEEVAAKSSFFRSEDDWTRIQKTAEVEGAISMSELVQKEQEFKRDSSRYYAAKMNTEAAQNYVKAASELSNYLSLKAPFDAQIINRNFHTGAYVAAQQKLPILQLHTPKQLRLEFIVPEQFASFVNEKHSLKITSKKTKQTETKLLISRRSGELDPKLRGEFFEANYSLTNSEFKPGSFVELSVPIALTNVFVIPKSSLVTDLEGRYIQVLDNNKIQKIDVEKGPSSKDSVVIYGALKEGIMVLKK